MAARNLRRRLPGRLLLLALVLSSAGCSTQRPKALSLSLTELGTESRVDAGSWWGVLRHRQAYNIAGTGAMDGVGMLSSDPDPSPLLDIWRSWFRQDLLPDQLALRLSPGCSKVFVKDFADPASITAGDVVAVRDGLQQVQNRVVDLVAGEAYVQLLGTLAKTNEDLAKLKEAGTSGTPVDVLERRREALAAWLSASGFGPVEEDQDLGPTIAAATRRVEVLRGELRAAERSFEDARRKPGIIVARWKIDDQRRSQVSATGVDAESFSQDNGAGFVVLGAPRVVTLAAGDDLVVRACGIDGADCDRTEGAAQPDARAGIDSVIPPKRLYVTTYQLLARHAAWTDARSLKRLQTLALRLNQVIGALSGATPKLLESIKALQLSLVRTSSTAVDAENMGALSATRLQTLPFSFATDALLERSQGGVIAASADYLVVSSMRSTLDGHILRQSGAATRLPPAGSCMTLAP